MPRKATTPSPKSKPSQPVPSRPAAEDASEISDATVRREIAKLAYQLSEKRGFAPGHETEDWLAAEAQVKARLGLTGKPN
jgi:hypothetical protein